MKLVGLRIIFVTLGNGSDGQLISVYFKKSTYPLFLQYKKTADLQYMNYLIGMVSYE